MAKPVGEDGWLAYLEETIRNASDLENRVHAVEQYKRAALASDGWTDEELLMGRELFSFGAALDLWQQGYEAIQ
ncbi:hypothetical protein BGZ61DRAFT_540825 [Ilyonectria robusta]|uniref:uncharacterized protein n=1 Tax=Ilyonectria robusta TaxID=1079257 RepID=UPI001E8E994B|nr:uncharacterized protein BGZ61DRAFT_540825 [Ilyonectria robusta]KAH8656732.1 hypothetical protein BGZ61DRAFT_540825 [Ilyonectria robusta]